MSDFDSNSEFGVPQEEVTKAISTAEFPAKKEQPTPSSNRFVEVDDMFEGMGRDEAYDLQDKIYENYADAMRMRDREPLESSRFQGHFFGGGNYEKSIAFGGPKDGYLLGSEVNDVFVPTHFAPSGLRGGYRLIKDLVDSDKPAALFITPDLVDTVRKMEGWKVLPFKMTTDFRGSDVEKTLVVNRWSALTKLATHQAGTVVRDRVAEARWKIKGLGEKAKNLIRRDRANADDMDEEVREAVLSDTDFEDNDEQYLGTATLAKLRDSKLFEDEETN